MTLGYSAATCIARALPLAFAVICAARAPAHAQPEGLALTWTAPADCQRAPEVRARIGRLLGGAKATQRRMRVAVDVRREEGSHFVADLYTEMEGGAGHKRLEGESCDAIALATSVVIALAIDPEASLDDSAHDQSRQPAGETGEPQDLRKRARKPRSHETAPTLGPAEVTPGSLGVSPYLQLSVGALLELMGEPSAFVSAGLGFRFRLVSLELSGALHQPRSISRQDRPNVGAELELYSAELLGCFIALSSELAGLEACTGAELAYMTARAVGVSHPGRGSVLLLSGVGVLRGRLRATQSLSATIDLGVSARSFRPTFVLVNVGDIFEVPGASTFARTGLSLEF